MFAALAAAGVGSAGCSGGGKGTTESASGGATANEDGIRNEDATASGTAVSEHAVDTPIALAEVVYPSEAENVGVFVRDYSAERVGAEEVYAAGSARR